MSMLNKSIYELCGDSDNNFLNEDSFGFNFHKFLLIKDALTTMCIFSSDGPVEKFNKTVVMP